MSSQKQQATIISSVPVLEDAQRIAKIGCWEHHHSSNTFVWSRELFQILELSPGSVTPSSDLFTDLIHPRDRAEQLEQYENHLKNHSEYNMEFRLMLGDGTIKYIHSKAETEFSKEDGRPLRTIGTFSDITKRARFRIALEVSKNDLEVILEDRVAELELTVDDLREANLELKNAQSLLVQSEKMASLGVLTAGIAHEINNPVNFIYGGVTSIEENLKSVEKILLAYETVNSRNVSTKLSEIALIREELHLEKTFRFLKRSIGNVKNGAERTAEIIKGLRSFSRMDDSLTSLTDITECLDNSLLILANQFEDRIKIIRDYAKSRKIECYPGKISQVFVNIISNSIHAIKGNGKITFQTSTIEKDMQDYLRIAISDTGSGIPKESQSHIFEPFYTTKEVGMGTGLGLSISHGIIEEHKGTIRFETEKDKGTTFVIELPFPKKIQE